ncbi:MAG: HEAT repeat domain-containing protein [Gemmatimonadota bacterium]|nr:MAG: HEAT repeat domain-containing protein [Gemmatimonadota bacterium]
MITALATLELVLEVAVIQALVLVALFFFRRISAAAQHRLLAAAVVAVILVTVASPFVPARHLGLVPVEDAAVRAEPGAPALIPAAPGADAPAAPVPGDPVAQPAPGTEVARPPASGVPSQPSWLSGSTLGTIWLAGTALVLLWIVGGLAYGWWLSLQTRHSENARLVDGFRWALEQTGLRRTIPLVESERLRIPVVFGWMRPKVILPAHAAEWPDDRLRAVLLHESAHIRRADLVYQFFAKLTCALYWFNPLAWVVERRLFLAGERAADDQVIRREVTAADYAEHLMATSEELGVERTPLWATAAMAEGTAFKDRILSILDPNVERGEPDMSDRAIVTLTAGAVIVSLVALSPWKTASSTPEPRNVHVMVADTPPAGVQAAVVANQPPRDVQDDFTTLIAMLQMEDASMREHAAEALGRLGDRRAVEPLMDAVLHDRNPSVREHAATALGMLADPRASEVLAQAAQADPNERVRAHAASAASRLGDRAAVPSLIDAVLNDEDPVVREHAATALGELGDPAARDPLIAATLDDSNARVREHAAVALGQVGGERACDVLLGVVHGGDVEEVRAHAAYALGLTGDTRALEPLLAALQDPSARMRAHAAQGLGELGDPAALEALRQAQGDPDGEVRRVAGEAIAMIRGRR